MPPIVLDEDEEDVAVAEGELQRGAAVRIQGLQGATHLNGQVALVVRFLADRQRYEVSLHSSGEFKSVLPANIAALPLLDEVELWRDELQKPEVNAQMARIALQRLSSLEVSVDVMQKTRVGKVVNELCKRLGEDGEASELGRRLVRRWREMFQRQQANERRAASAASTPAVAPASATAAAPAAAAPPAAPVVQPRPPPPAAAPAAPQAAEGRAKPPGGLGPTPPPASADVAGGSAGEAKAASSLKLPRIEKPEDAPRLVRVMRSASSDPMRAAAIAALEQTAAARLPDFIAAGGHLVLDKWLRASVACRDGCLGLLQRLPVTQKLLAESRLGSAISLVATTELDAAVAAKAAALQAKWRAAGLLAQAPAPPPIQATAPAPAPRHTAPVEPVQPERKRMRLGEEPTAPPPPAAPTTPPEPAAATRPPAVQESLLPELAKLDPRIAKVLMERPVILQFLTKHRSIMNNMNAQTVAFLVRNLRNSKDTQEEESMADDEDDGGTCTVTVSNLHPEATEDDVSILLNSANLWPVEVNLPRESRRQRSCGVAFAVLPTREEARSAVRELQGAVVRGRAVRIEPADGANWTRTGDRGGGAGARRIKWKAEEELWDVALFDKNESVTAFRERVHSGNPVESQQEHAEASARFQAAARKEHEEERKMVRDALAHH